MYSGSPNGSPAHTSHALVCTLTRLNTCLLLVGLARPHRTEINQALIEKAMLDLQGRMPCATEATAEP